MSSKRHSILPTIDRSGPKPPVNFSSSLVISDNALLSGTHSITLQAETLVHPRSRIESSQGSILVGRRCIIQERAHLGAKAQDMATARSGGVSLGDYVMVEAGTIVECGGTEIGEGTILQIGSRICSGAKIGKNCTITSLAVIPAGTELPDFTIVFSNGSRRIDKRPATELRKVAIVKQIATLKHVIPSNPDKFK